MDKLLAYIKKAGKLRQEIAKFVQELIKSSTAKCRQATADQTGLFRCI